MRARQLLRALSVRRRTDERGATFVLTAICMVVLLWGGAMGIDVGFSVSGSRTAQAMADTGALDLARYINIADGDTLAASQTYMAGELANVMADNSGSNANLTVSGCVWNSSTQICTVPTGANAGCYNQIPKLHNPCTGVIVTATQKVPQIFFGGSNSVSRSATAAVTPEDGFSIGTYLASFDSQQSAVLNDILSTIGTTATITAAGYEGLDNTYVTVNQLITASAGTLTPSNVLTTSLTPSTWLSFLKTATSSQQALLNCGASPVPSPCAAYSALNSLVFNGSPSVELCQLFTIDGANCSPGIVSEQGLSANLDVLQFLTTEAELANGSNSINVQSALGITGVTSSTLTLVVGQLPQIAYGPVGTTASTAQVTADLKLNVTAAGGIVDIPLSAAQGTGTLSAENCSEQNNSFGNAIVSASTTTATANLTLNGASAGTLTITGASSTPAQFNSTVVPPTASTQSAATNPMQVGTTSPTLSYSGLGSSLTTLPALLTGVFAPVLQAAGVAVGGATVADLNYNCGAVSIVK